MVSEDTPWFRAYGRFARALTNLLLAISGASLLAMVALITVDVVLRKCFNAPITGSRDIVGILGALCIGAALPYTTAVKGHVAIEFFFQMLPRGGREFVDFLARLLVLVFFAFLAWYFVIYGLNLRSYGQVTPTIQIPEFWVPFIYSISCACVVLVKVYHLLQPGKTMIKP